jgi:hypothetical protein
MVAVIVWQGAEHEIAAVQPEFTILPSEVNLNVKHPVGLEGVAWHKPGPAVPVYVPSVGAAIEFPSYTVRKSKLFSSAKAVKLTTISLPAVLGQMVYTNDWLLP